MKTVTIHVEEADYAELQRNARRRGRSTSELMREAIREQNARLKRAERGSLGEAPAAASVGKVLNPWSGRGDLLEGYFERE